MLSHLNIQNLALVEKLAWELESGLISITGETGAGKSVIVGALKLILGERAEKSLIRTGQSSCHVEAIFSMHKITPINDFLEEAGLDRCEDGQLIIKRVLGQTSNKQFINNSPVTLTILKKLGTELMDLHGPHDHQSLLSMERQLQMLDAYAGNASLLQAYAQTYSEWREKSMRLEDLRNSERTNAQELDLLRFQVNEIDSAELDPDEEKDTQNLYQRVSNSTKLAEHAAKITSLLKETISEPLNEVQRAAVELAKLDPAVESRIGGLEQAILELNDLEQEILTYGEELEIDPEAEHQLANRINTFETLKRKYGSTLNAVIAHGEQARQRIFEIENRDNTLEQLQQELDTLHQALLKAGDKISINRKKVTQKLSKTIETHLQDLGFKQATFQVKLTPHKQATLSGLEGVDFQFGPNPGEPLKPLRQIASSGEISRVMLAVKSALAAQDSIPLMVFDEIDANVGGEIARAVGKKMAALATKHQVISITHFPQVAAIAKQHFVVEKQIVEGRTHSSLKLIEGEARIGELVRMLGGGKGEQAIAMAKSLLP